MTLQNHSFHFYVMKFGINHMRVLILKYREGADQNNGSNRDLPAFLVPRLHRNPGCQTEQKRKRANQQTKFQGVPIDIKPDGHVPHERPVHHGDTDERKGNQDHPDHDIDIANLLVKAIQIQVRMASDQSPGLQNTKPGTKK